MARFTAEAGAALAFGILYFLLCLWLYAGYFTGRFKLRSRWTLLTFHATIRVASQACGVAFGILAFDNVSVFVAYLVLGAEGYFTLTLAAYLFLNSWLHHNTGESFIKPYRTDKEERWKVIRDFYLLLPLWMPWRYWNHNFMSIVECTLIPANAIIVAGGSLLSGTLDSNTGLASPDKQGQANAAKGMRVAGSVVFYIMTSIFYGCLVHVIYTKGRRRSSSSSSYSSCLGIHPTLAILIVVSCFLFVRGIFGVLQAAVDSLSYLSPSNYTGDGFTSRFTALEYCLTVLPEFSSALLLSITYYTSRNDPALHKDEIAALNGGRGQQGGPTGDGYEKDQRREKESA